MTAPKVKVTITGHRIDQESMRNHRGLRNVLNIFANAYSVALAERTGEYISDMLGRGAWWTSINPRFGKYRSWIKFRYGSDRNRKQGRRREGTKSETLSTLESDADIKTWGNVQHLAMQWLIRKLRTAAVPAKLEDKGSRMVITARTSKGTQPIDVTGAIRHLERVARRNQTMPAHGAGDLSQREMRLRNLRELFDKEGDVRMELSRTAYGQKLLRYAEIQAVRQVRQHQADKMRHTKKGTERKRTPTGANFKWGVQTGQFRDAWLNATGKKTFDGKTLRITVTPANTGQGINAWRLTELLQAKIAKAGGDPRLLRGAGSKRVMREALEAAMEEVEMNGIRFRLRKGEK